MALRTIAAQTITPATPDQNTAIAAIYKCGKCSGRGKIPGFAHYDNGRCFDCGGSGRLSVETSPAKILNARASAALYSAENLLSVLANGREDLAPAVARQVAAILFTVGTDRARSVLSDLTTRCSYHDDYSPRADCRTLVSAEIAREARDMIVAAGRAMKG